MPKINLIKRKPGVSPRVGSVRPTENVVWYISKKIDDKTYFVNSVAHKSGAVKWTTKRARGMSFRTEVGVYYFIDHHLKGRHDIFLIKRIMGVRGG